MSLDQSERYIAIGTDGVWDTISPEDVIDIINEHGLRRVGEGSEYLVTKIKDLCFSAGRSLDDTTIVISHINKNDYSY